MMQGKSCMMSELTQKRAVMDDAGSGLRCRIGGNLMDDIVNHSENIHGGKPGAGLPSVAGSRSQKSDKAAHHTAANASRLQIMAIARIKGMAFQPCLRAGVVPPAQSKRTNSV